jgi:predicted ArsR family transcriptional regulator
MADADFPVDVEQFLAAELEGYEQLEALLLVSGSATRSFDREEVAAALGIGVDAAAEALEHLYRRGLAALEPTDTGPRFRYTSQDTGREATIRRLARLYDERRIEIVQRITANAIERLRTAAIRRFSDAFLLRKDKKDDG